MTGRGSPEKRVLPQHAHRRGEPLKVKDRSMKRINGLGMRHGHADERVTVDRVSRGGSGTRRRISRTSQIHLKCSGGTKHRFEFDFDRKVPCGKEEVYRVFATNRVKPERTKYCAAAHR